MTSDLDAGAPLTLAQLMPAPGRRPPWRRRWVLTLAALLAAAGVVAGAVLVARLPAPARPAARPIGPLRADAVRECRSAVESEAQRRATVASGSGSGSATVTIGGVDVAEPVWSATLRGWTLDATIRFTVVSVLGQVPASVYVRCTARSDNGRVSTAVGNR